MSYGFTFRTYRRKFRQPLQTSHGSWEVREGIILRLVNEKGNVGWGEIAPLPWFGSENLAEAEEFCRQLGETMTAEDLAKIPDTLPACQFGFNSAQENCHSDSVCLAEIAQNCYLLPAGKKALTTWQTAPNQGKQTFKWKIGIGDMAEEIAIFRQLSQALPATAKLRLDANGGLNLATAKQWLEVSDASGKVEFLEQPLPPQQFDEMLNLNAEFLTAIALDESVATLAQLTKCYAKGWRGIFVIKAAIAGSPQSLRQFCRQNQIDAVFSSVLETEIGRQAALKLATEISLHPRALGFGVDHWFAAPEDNWLEKLWKNC
ncbi:o-succinylbenzoate synthase [Oscillatoria salina]|uniref:o-succinylbenzoate synthase n=1 Tax=Oscillatoria salina TaxID=331517 RepID=UPI0013B8BC50|nr:o-succinylbenzoate synthase [Oscillatoria salina]MBZ8182840.1 o-succinylbenzoate synthase [Oscillatoria salina IIICB1]NET89952.1 o-succinylbenzoate synthase [Kamptonema sp. SIO1D9]